MKIYSKRQPLVTIVTPCYNHEKYIFESLDSVRNQTYSNIQHIIIDDCSKDNSVKIIEDYIEKYQYKCTFIKHTKNTGICKLLNESISISKGKYWSGCTSDDVIMPDKIEKQVEILERLDSKVGVVYSDAFLMDGDSKLIKGMFIEKYRTFSKIPQGDIFNELLEGNFIPVMALLLRTSIFDDIGTFDENLQYEDYDFWLRIATKYYFYFSDRPSAKYRLHSDNLHLKIDYDKAEYSIFSKHLHLNNEFINKKIVKSIEFEYFSDCLAAKEKLLEVEKLIKIPVILRFVIKMKIPPFFYILMKYFQKKYRRLLILILRK